MKGVVTIILLLFVAASVTYFVVGEARSKAVPLDPAVNSDQMRPVASESLRATSNPSDKKQPPELAAYYFHGTSRCATCLTMEQYAREAIEGAYHIQLENGRVRWQAVNYDEPANEHFVKEYGLVASSLVIVSDKASTSSGWRKLDRIWDLIGDEQAFKNYVIDEVRMMLGSDP